MDGLWTMRYATVDHGKWLGGGVLYARGDTLWGGDSGHYWTGTVEEKRGGIAGTLDVIKFIPEFDSICPGVTGDRFTLKFRGGDAHLDTFWAGGELKGRPEFRFAVQLTRCDYKGQSHPRG